MKRQSLTEREYQILFMADDALGLTSLIAKNLDLTNQQVNEFGSKLAERGLVTSTKSYQGADEYWFEATPLGQEVLRKEQHLHAAPE